MRQHEWEQNVLLAGPPQTRQLCAGFSAKSVCFRLRSLCSPAFIFVSSNSGLSAPFSILALEPKIVGGDLCGESQALPLDFCGETDQNRMSYVAKKYGVTHLTDSARHKSTEEQVPEKMKKVGRPCRLSPEMLRHRRDRLHGIFE